MLASSIFITVAEPSADANAALVVAELRALRPSLRVRAIGGPALRAAGAELLADTVAGAAMGLGAALRAVEVSRLLARVRRDWEADRPALLICTDSWSMNVHFAKLAKSQGIPVLYYVAPQTWASREGRVLMLRKVVDHLACILPFEERYFRDRGVPTTYVGHPLFDRLEQEEGPGVRGQGSGVRGQGSGVRGQGSGRETEASRKTVGILPGSRAGVTRQNWPRLLEVMHAVQRELPGTRFKIPLTPNAAPIVRASTLPPHTEAKEDAVDELIPQCDLCLCVSGTAALHVAAHRVPLLVVYYGNPVLWHLLGRWIVRTRTYSLVNLLAGARDDIAQGATVAPEYIPWYGSTGPVAEHAIRLLKHPVELAAMQSKLAGVIGRISAPGASRRVAEIALGMMGPKEKINR